ncbi:hypothetical protein [Nocardia sp. BMG111209]|uniref:hypothetical protein n=1 Tax=Nocardia sp. BMG111209 TaxID=1160137 RepID=UPI0012DD7FF7|nr:hypothetical protein [Nocardia sp. BMG111209]
MLIVTHEMSFARAVASRILFLDKGSVVAIGTPGEIFGSTDARIRRFLETTTAATVPVSP